MFNLNNAGISLVTAALFTLLVGCNGDDSKANEPVAVGECGAHGVPRINVRLHDSLDDALVIDDATVLIIEESETASQQDYAEYIPEGETHLAGEPGAYFTLMTINAISYNINIEVTAEGYNAAVVKNIPFELDSSCMAENNVSYDVYLCPLNTNCL
ncbi:hypothetical protein JYB87_10085 [Shewanella avicenniae]|uniref:Carboxypeptidase regulatory-like domain-containing protein n=1 Tax=Shewanella avicenniae TaxID=2814294 RepID=A0ABX7QMZ9_9GAMM|nr:hypothetical protein [Shewanella avicenniae]QSX32135.1 hypothetical protein JYB87_10085 [Shewanella avicenniae]